MKKKMKSLGDRLSDAKKAAHNAFSNQEIRLLLEKYGYNENRDIDLGDRPILNLTVR